jgi:polysaccharide biosynthesis transport protein
VNYWQVVQRIGRGVLRRRKRLALISMLAALALLVPAAHRLSKEPPRFKSSALILLEAKPDRVPVFQEFSPYRPLPVQLAILQSRSLAESVIDGLPKSSLQDLIENPYRVDYIQMMLNAYLRARGQEPEVESPQRRALSELQQARVKFDMARDGLVTISAEASKPQVAVDIVNAYIETLMARTRSFNMDDARVTREFLEQQLADVKKTFTASEEALRSFVNVHGGVKIPERSQATVAQLSQAENALAEVESSRKMLQSRLETWRAKVERQKATAPTPGAPPQPAAPRSLPPEGQRLRAQLAQLETILLDLRTRYTDDHPRVRLVKDRIDEVQRQLGPVIKESTPVMPAAGAVPSTERVNFSEQLVTLETSFQALSAQEEALRKQAEELRQSLKGLSTSESQYTRLLREAESSRNLHAMLADKLTAARIREQGEMKVVKVIDPPSFPQPALSEKRLRLFALALVLSAVIGAGVPAGVEWLHRTIETEGDVETATGLPVLALIPQLRSRRPSFDGAYETTGKTPSEQFMFTEAFRALRVVLQLEMRREQVRTLLIASPFAHEGKSMVVLNLGLAFAEAGQRVVVAETDFLRPTLQRRMHADSETGLVEALDATHPLEASLTPVGERMWIAPRGRALPPSARGLLASRRMSEVLAELTQRSDLVICDSSPALLVPDNLFLASAVNGVVLVAKFGRTGCRDLARAKSLLETVGARILGVVINDVPTTVVKRHYRRYYHAYVKREHP